MAWQRREMLGAGAKAPEFRLEDLDGRAHSLKEMLARGPVLLAFFKVSCPVCQYTFPYLERLHEAGGGAVQIVGVSQDKARDTRSYNEEFGVTFTTLLDASGYPASNAYGLTSVPSLFLVEQDGTISLSTTGFSKKDLEALGERLGVAAFQAGERVPEFRPG